MARTFAKFKGAMWAEDDWRDLREREQRLYMLLVTQPQISNVGVLPLVPRRWARLSADSTEADLRDTLADLQRARFLFSDWDAEELLIRTFIKHDQIADQPNLLTAAKRQYSELESLPIKRILASEYPSLFTLPEGVQPGVPATLWQTLYRTLPETLTPTLPQTLREGRAREGLQATGLGMEGSPVKETPTVAVPEARPHGTARAEFHTEENPEPPQPDRPRDWLIEQAAAMHEGDSIDIPRLSEPTRRSR